MKIENIKKLILKNIEEYYKADIKAIKSATAFEAGRTSTKTINKSGEGFYIRETITERQAKKTNAEIKNILINKVLKTQTKKQEETNKAFEEIAAAQIPVTVEMVINWTGGSVYGWQASAEVWTDSLPFWVKGSKTGGWGYDKASTAAANALNQLNGLKKLFLINLSKQKAQDIKQIIKGKKDPRGIFGYGLHFWRLPYIDGGIGIESTQSIMTKAGYITKAARHSDTGAWFYLWELAPKKQKQLQRAEAVKND